MSEWSKGVQKVLRHVARTKGWVLCDVVGRQELRRDNRCPLESLTSVDGVSAFLPKVHSIGLTDEDANRVVAAADDLPSGVPLRAALLKAARLA